MKKATYHKITVGFVIQKYNADGKCVGQSFVAGDEVTYEDMNGEPIEVSTESEQYQPFEMVQPEQPPTDGLEFTCPDCGSHRLECCLDGPHTAEVTKIDEEGDCDYGPYESSSYVDRFQCLNCGYVLELKCENNHNIKYTVTDHEDIVEWINENKSEGYTDPRYLDDNADKFENE